MAHAAQVESHSSSCRNPGLAVSASPLRWRMQAKHEGVRIVDPNASLSIAPCTSRLKGHEANLACFQASALFGDAISNECWQVARDLADAALPFRSVGVAARAHILCCGESLFSTHTFRATLGLYRT